MPCGPGNKETAPRPAFELASSTHRMRISADQEHPRPAKGGSGILRNSFIIQQKDNGTERSTGFEEAAEKEGCV